MRNKFVFICIVFFILFICLIHTNKSYASVKLQGIENFPDSYKPYLEELKRRYPNWEFTALYTALDWNYVISNEYGNDKNLVPLSYTDFWKCTTQGKYNVEIDAGWVNASKQAVEYTMDPRNFLNEVRIFQFEKLSYDPNSNQKTGVEKILYGTEFYDRLVSYKLADGTIINTDQKYSDLIWSAAIYSGVSPYHVASRIKQEVGPFITHNSISGTISGYEGLYNFYNIGATSHTDPLQVIKNGLQYAKDGKGANEDLKANYLIPWNTPEKSITGGAVFIGASYINVGQNTLYLQKFDVNDDRSSSLFWHQYMTNCLAPYSESNGIYKAYSSNEMLSSSIGFLIPIYENMPAIPTSSPNILTSDYIAENTKVYADVSTTLNIRSGPGTSYESLIQIDRNQILTRIGRGVQSGERWDKIQLENGMIGYVFASYIKEIPNIRIENINLKIDNNTIYKDTTSNITIEILPSEAKDDTVIWTSSDENIVTVDNGEIRGIRAGSATITASSQDKSVAGSIDITVYTPISGILISKEKLQLEIGKTSTIIANIYPIDATNQTAIFSSDNTDVATVSQIGKIEAIGVGTAKITASIEGFEATCEVIVKEKEEGTTLEFNESLDVIADEISGIDLNNNKVSDILNLVNTNLIIELYNSKDERLNEDDLVGTGTKLILKDNLEEELYTYTFVVYGDVNGDGQINALDSLVIQRHILETKLITGVFLKTGNLSKDGNLPNALDVLKIQRHILEIKFIEQ